MRPIWSRSAAPGASRTSAVSATESPSGFSASTHLPASSAARTSPAVADGGVAITTASTLRIREHGRRVGRRSHARRRGGEAPDVEVGDRNQLDARVAVERGQVGADGDVAEADQPDPRGEPRSRVRP